jgi:hypothetical protein
MNKTIRFVATAAWLLTSATPIAAQRPASTQPQVSEDVEPRTIGGKGTTMIGFSGYVDRFFSSERGMSTNYTTQFDIGRFVTPRLVVRGGIAGSGSVGGEDAETAVGIGVPALHLSAGLLHYFTPRSMLSLFVGGEYSTALTRRDATERGSLMGLFGIQGAVSARASVFVEGGYGTALMRGEDDEALSRAAGRIGLRLKF